MWLAVARPDIGSVALAAPDGPPDEAFREIKRSVLVLSGTKDQSDAGDRYRTLLPDCQFMFVYDAGRPIGAERPEALAFIALEFFERGDLFLVSRENGQERKIRDRPPCADSGHSRNQQPHRQVREGFRMPVRREGSTRYRWPASESLRRTNARESSERLAVYGD
jgi:hypothetical protein